MLNLIQHPGAVTRLKSVASEADDRAWMLNQVQHDDSSLG
jgi:hypothetical protein